MITHLLDKTITIRRPTASVDAGGGPVETMANHLTGVRARIQPSGGREVRQYGGMLAEVDGSVFVDGGQDIKADDEILYGSRTLTIVYVHNWNESDDYLRLDYREDK